MTKACFAASAGVLVCVSMVTGQVPARQPAAPRGPVATAAPAWTNWLGLLAVTASSFAFDPAVRGSAPPGPSGSEFGRFGYGVTNLTGLWPVALGATVVGTIVDRDAPRIALEMAGGVAAAALATDFLKRATGRARPSQTTDAYRFDAFGGYKAFPSGHATAAFAIAGAIAAESESPWLRGGAFTLAAIVGSARVSARAHWASDVVAGALVGTVAGYETTRRLRALRVGTMPESALRFVPLADGMGVGAQIPFSFTTGFGRGAEPLR